MKKTQSATHPARRHQEALSRPHAVPASDCCMVIRYDEWFPGAGLEGIVTAYWRVAGDASRLPSPAVLPDGHVELVFNLGDPVALAGPAYSGEQPDRAVVGPLSKAIRLKYRARVNTFGIRFHPACGAGFLSQPATALTDKLIPLAQVCVPLDQAFSQLLTKNESLETDAGRAALDRVLLKQLPLALPRDLAIVTLVERLNCLETAPLVSQLAREVRLSPRQLQRRFLAAVGMPPKRFVRVVRFARLWQLASMSSPETWATLAADHGYADQAHMVREFRFFGAEPPTRVFTPDWYETTEMSRAVGPTDRVRSVQDPGGKPRA